MGPLSKVVGPVLALYPSSTLDRDWIGCILLSEGLIQSPQEVTPMNTISRWSTIGRLFATSRDFERARVYAVSASKRKDHHFARFWAQQARSEFQLVTNYALAIQDRIEAN